MADLEIYALMKASKQRADFEKFRDQLVDLGRLDLVGELDTLRYIENRTTPRVFSGPTESNVAQCVLPIILDLIKTYREDTWPDWVWKDVVGGLRTIKARCDLRCLCGSYSPHRVCLGCSKGACKCGKDTHLIRCMTCRSN